MAAHRQNMAYEIAQCAIDHYDQTLPSNNGGKPQAGREWTVYAAIVAVRHRNDYTNESLGEGTCSSQNPETWVVSCATGSKCTSIRSILPTFPSTRSKREGRGTNFENVIRSRKCGTSQLGLDEDSICQCYKGMVLKDSHAETLARRGLMACLWNEVENALEKIAKGKKSRSDEAAKESNVDSKSRHLLLEVDPSPKLGSGMFTSFRLRKDITLHMYVSDSPCGDATLYEIEKKSLSPAQNEACNVESQLNFTGAKIIISGTRGKHARTSSSISSLITTSHTNEITNGDNAITLGREETQQLGALRIKSSRSNIPPNLRSMSMSCSDKLVRWGVFGIQGSLLAMFIPEPICLSSISVSRDPRSIEGGAYGGQIVALERALSGRIAAALKSLTRVCDKGVDVKPPDVAIVDHMFESSKSASEGRYFNARISERKRTIGRLRRDSSGGKEYSKRQKACTGDEKESTCKGTPKNNHGDSRPADKNIKRESAAGMSINWHQQSGTGDITKRATEITIGATGMKRGKKPKSPKDVVGAASRLSRFHLLRQCKRCIIIDDSIRPISNETIEAMRNEKASYVHFKQLGGAASDECFLGPLAGWIRSGKQDDFTPN